MINSVRPFRCGYTYRLISKNVHTYLYISILAFTHILFLSLYILLKSLLTWNCPGSRVVKTPHSTVWGLGSISGGKLRPCMPLVGPKKKFWLQNEKGTRLCANMACSSFSINSFIFRLTCLVKLGETCWMKLTAPLSVSEMLTCTSAWHFSSFFIVWGCSYTGLAKGMTQ